MGVKRVLSQKHPPIPLKKCVLLKKMGFTIKSKAIKQIF
ncbi:hypothetical protein HPGAM_00460 [Helicobacter pylori Gambia94/24]|nr:hypothetical protein HPGAM_00460 [Helicobacter pylori Gambia94/24]